MKFKLITTKSEIINDKLQELADIFIKQSMNLPVKLTLKHEQINDKTFEVEWNYTGQNRITDHILFRKFKKEFARYDPQLQIIK